MDTLQIKAILAGIAFGIWPLLMNRSGLNGNSSSTVFTGIVFACVLPFAINSYGNNTNTNWVMAIIAGLLGAVGILSFNGMLAKATPQNVSTLFVLMIVAQTAIPAIYNVFMNGDLSASKGLGFVFAIVAAILLTR